MKSKIKRVPRTSRTDRKENKALEINKKYMEGLKSMIQISMSRAIDLSASTTCVIPRLTVDRA